MGGFIVWSVYSDSLQKERRKITFPINHKSILFAFKSPYLKETSPKLVLVDAQDYVDTVDTNVEISSLLLQLKTNCKYSSQGTRLTLHRPWGGGESDEKGDQLGHTDQQKDGEDD